MSDFDTVLERLVTDPAFQAALAADPTRALAGYQLEPQERELLGAQLVGGAGEDRTVELRTSKSGVVGLLGPVAAAFGLTATHQSFGSGPGAGHESFGEGPGHQAFGAAVGSDGGSAAGTPGGATEVFGSAGHEEFGNAPDDSTGTFGAAPVEATDYHTRVDVDGDGTWDAYTAYERPDGGVDITVDVDHDGGIDFVGHDYDRDGLVDDADFDRNRDGVLDTRMFDDDGDGWMDRREAIPPPPPPPAGHAAPPPSDGGEHQAWG